MERKIKEKVTGFRTKDGAGVSLVRVITECKYFTRTYLFGVIRE